jgi:hypothetical protein
MFLSTISPADLASSISLMFLRLIYTILTVYPVNIGILLITIFFIGSKCAIGCLRKNERVKLLKKSNDTINSKKTK